MKVALIHFFLLLFLYSVVTVV